MTNAKRQKKFRDKMREIKSSQFVKVKDEIFYTERTTGERWQLIKIFHNFGHYEIVKTTQTDTPRVYRKTRVISSNVLKVNYVEHSEKVA